MITDGWHKLAEEQSEEGQRVLAMSSHGRYPMRYGNASLLYLSLNSSNVADEKMSHPFTAVC